MKTLLNVLFQIINNFSTKKSIKVNMIIKWSQRLGDSSIKMPKWCARLYGHHDVEQICFLQVLDNSAILYHLKLCKPVPHPPIILDILNNQYIESFETYETKNYLGFWWYFVFLRIPYEIFYFSIIFPAKQWKLN